MIEVWRPRGKARQGLLRTLNSQIVFLHHRVRQQVAAYLVELRVGRCLLEVQLDELAHSHRLCPGHAVMPDGVAHGYALRIENALFWHNGDHCFHETRIVTARLTTAKDELGSLPDPDPAAHRVATARNKPARLLLVTSPALRLRAVCQERDISGRSLRPLPRGMR